MMRIEARAAAAPGGRQPDAENEARRGVFKVLDQRLVPAM